MGRLVLLHVFRTTFSVRTVRLVGKVQGSAVRSFLSGSLRSSNDDIQEGSRTVFAEPLHPTTT